MKTPFKFKTWIGMLAGVLLMIPLGVANAGTSPPPPTNTDTPMTQSG